MEDSLTAIPAVSLVDFLTPLTLLLQKNWARQFLLESTPESGLAVLTSKIHQQHGLTGEIRNVRSDPEPVVLRQDDSWVSTPGLKSFFNANWAIIPAFNVDHYSALVFLKEETNRWDKSIFAQDGFACSQALPVGSNKLVQVIINNETGTTVGIFDDENFYYIMCLLKRDQFRTRHRGFMRIPKDVLLSNELSALMSSIPVLVHTSETRFCSKCPPTMCICPPPKMVRPRFALDLTSTRQNMMSQVGIYIGHLQSSVMPSSGFGRESIKTTPIIGGLSGGSSLPGMFPRLLSWGITHLLAQALTNSTPSKSPFPIDLAVTAQRAIGEQLKLLSSEQYGSNEDPDNAVLCLAGVSANDSGNERASLAGAEYGVDIGLVNESVLDQALGISNLSEQSSESPATRFLPMGEIGTMPKLNGTFGVEVGTVPHAVDSMNSFSSQINIPIQPTPLIPSQHQSAQPPQIPIDNSPEGKALRRKLRNRESAARSNLKKQLRTAELKKKLKDAREQQKTLESRLNMLRRENGELLKQISE